MRAALRSFLAVSSIAATMVAAPVGARVATASLSQGDFAVASVLPAPKGVVGVAHPVVVTFGKPVVDRHTAERTIALKSKPAMTGKFVWLNNEVAQWVPDRYWPAHSTIELSVGGLKTEFQTGSAVLGVADITNHTFTVTIDGIEVTPPRPAPHHRPHWGEDGVLPASMGRPHFPTPVGSYTVLSKDRSVTMDSSSVGVPIDEPEGYRLTVDYAVRFSNSGLYVHSAPWAVPSMGIENVSHGCISLSPADAEWYYENVKVGDPVIVQKGVESQDKTASPDPVHMAGDVRAG